MMGQVIAGEGEWILAMLLSSLVIPKKYVCPNLLSTWPGHISVMANDQPILRTSVFFSHWLRRQIFVTGFLWFSNLSSESGIWAYFCRDYMSLK